MREPRKSSLAFWVTAAIAVPLLYVASFGPACWVTSWCGVRGGWILVMYRPIIWLVEEGPVSEYVLRYSFLGAATGWGWEIGLDGHITDWGPI